MTREAFVEALVAQAKACGMCDDHQETSQLEKELEQEFRCVHVCA